MSTKMITGTKQEIAVHAADQIQKFGPNKEFFPTFIKRTDGSVRKMRCETGNGTGVKGVGRKFNPGVRSLLGVFDLDKQGHRFVNLNDVKRLKIGEHEFHYVDKDEPVVYDQQGRVVQELTFVEIDVKPEGVTFKVKA